MVFDPKRLAQTKLSLQTAEPDRPRFNPLKLNAVKESSVGVQDPISPVAPKFDPVKLEAVKSIPFQPRPLTSPVRPPIKLPTDTGISEYKPPLLRRIGEGYRKLFRNPEAEKAKATNILGLSEKTGLRPSMIDKDYERITKDEGLRQYPTTGEIINAAMIPATAAAIPAVGPLKVLKGVAGFMAAKEIGERAVLPAAKAGTQALTKQPIQYEVTKLKEFLPDSFSDTGDILDFVVYGSAAGAAGKFMNSPRIQGELAGIRYRILKSFGIEQPNSLVPLTKEQMVKVYGEAGAARRSPEIFREELRKRGTPETPEPVRAPGMVSPGGGRASTRETPPIQPSIGGPVARVSEAPQPIMPVAPTIQPIQPKQPLIKPKTAVSRPKSLVGYIKQKYGGINPASITDYNVSEDFRQSGLMGILNRRGGDFSKIATDITGNNLIPGHRPGDSEAESLMRALKSKQGYGESAQEPGKLIKNYETEQVQRTTDEVDALVRELSAKGIGPERIRELIKTGEEATDFDPKDFEEKQTTIPGTESKFPEGPIRPADKDLVQQKQSGDLFKEKSKIFFSQAEKTIQEKMPNSTSPDQVRGILKNSGVKQDEIDWIDVDQFLEGKEKVSKKELLDYIRDNNVQVQEVKKGGHITSYENDPRDVESGEPEPEGGVTKFKQYQLPGGENYRELLLTLPTKENRPSRELLGGEPEIFENKTGEIDSSYGSFDLNPGETAYVYPNGSYIIRLKNGDFSVEMYNDSFEYKDLKSAEDRLYSGFAAPEGIAEPTKDFKSSHFDEPNVLAHIRFNDRTDVDGKKVLFIEEVQSDWHQKGRKSGYLGQEKRDIEGIKKRSLEITEAQNEIYIQYEGKRPLPREALDKLESLDQEYRSLIGESHDLGEKVPNAPFKKTWHELALKRILRYAVENGYEKIGWTSGNQQAERYDLSKQIDSIEFEKDRLNKEITLAINKDGRRIDVKKFPIENASEIENYVGKEVAKKIGESQELNGTLSGLDLKVGGQGMKIFYDQIIPLFLNKYTKKWGGRVMTSDIVPTGEKLPFMRVQTLELTPSLKESVLGGQPLFKESGQGRLSTSEIEIQKFQKIIDRHGIKDITIAVVDEIQTPSGRGAYGAFDPETRLARFIKQPTSLTGYHESFHAIRRNSGIKENLWQEAFQEIGGKDDIPTEEKLADKFAEYANSRDKKGFSDKLKRLFESIIDFIRKVFGRSDKLKNLFKEVYEPKDTRFQARPEVFKQLKKEPALFQDKQKEFRGFPKPVKTPSFGKQFTKEERVDIYKKALEKGLIYEQEGITKTGRFKTLLRHFKDFSSVRIIEYIDSLLGEKGNPPLVLRIWGDIEHDLPVMKLIKEESTGWKDLNSIELSTLDPFRAVEKITGKEIWDNNLLADNTYYVFEAADSQRFDRKVSEIAKIDALGVKPGSGESRDIQFKAEKGMPLTAKEQSVVNVLRKSYDNLIKEANDVRAILGYKPIPYRQNYFTHIIDRNLLFDFFKGDTEKFGRISNEQLDAIRRGDFTRGDLAFNRFAQRRLGKKTRYDAIGNFHKYLDVITREIYYTPAARHARKFVDYALIRQPNAYKYMQNLISDLRGKVSQEDKNLFGRVFNNKFVKFLRVRMAKNALIGNINFWATNASNFATSYPVIGNYLNKGLMSMIGDPKMRAFALKNSTTLKGRQIDPEFEIGMFSKAEKTVQYMTTLIEDLNVGGTFIGAYKKAIDEGMGQKEAIKYADSIALKTQAGYKLYQIPPYMRSEVGRVFSQFQNWSFNAMNSLIYDYKLGDLPRHPKNVQWKKLMSLVVVAIIVNQIYKRMGLREPFKPSAAVPKVPFVTSSRFEEPPIMRLGTDIKKIATAKKPETKGRAALRVGTSIIPPFGGTQINRFLQGRIFPEIKKKKKPGLLSGTETGLFSEKKTKKGLL